MSGCVLRPLLQRTSNSARRASCRANLAWRPLSVLYTHSSRCSSTEAASTTFPKSHATNAEKPFYITTPIFYVNADPHVGHLYTVILADILKRWQMIKNPTRRVRLSTGVDEHGMKIQQAAAAANTPPKEFCDRGAQVFSELVQKANVLHTDFVRTTDPEHIKSVQHCWNALREKGYIYEKTHKGWYSVSDETFYPDAQIEKRLDPATGRTFLASKETGKEVEWTSEVNYHFKLSAFKDRLLQLYKDNPNMIVPAQRRDEVVDWIQNNLDDLSISRPRERLTWGIPVPGDQTQTIYVWLDALTNYINRAGYPWLQKNVTSGGWPADIQVIGKDIVRFHCIYWPAFLMALDIPVPKQFLVHAHWTMNRQKMSKSTGNVVNPFFAMNRWGVDAMRYYLAHDGGILNDGDYDNDRIDVRYRTDLKGGLGNLLSRTVKFKTLPMPRAIELAKEGDYTFSDPETTELKDSLSQLALAVDEKFTALDIPGAVKLIREVISQGNKYLHAQGPWSVRPNLDTPEVITRGYQAIYMTCELLRITSILIQPFMPTKAGEVLDQLGVSTDRRTVQWAVFGGDLDFGVVNAADWGAEYGRIFPKVMV